MTPHSHTAAKSGSSAPKPGLALPKAKLVVVSGLSGSGKTEAIRVLEDNGYYCVDNLPLSLLEKFLELCDTSGVTRIGAVIDIRERDHLGRFPGLFQSIVQSGRQFELIYLEASNETVIKRYKETRRVHPLAALGAPLDEAVENERRALKGLRDMADVIIDTSNLNVHQLKKTVLGYVSPESRQGKMVLSITSFGFKHGLPREADLVFDVRFLPNPFFVDELRALTGISPEVSDYVFSHPEAVRFMDILFQMMEFTLPLYEQEGKPFLTVAIGCTGGRHRSVALAAELAARVSQGGRTVTVRHRDVDLSST